MVKKTKTIAETMEEWKNALNPTTEQMFKMDLQALIGKHYPDMNIDKIMQLIKNEYPEDFI